jgi:hypothetical protein
MEISKVGNKYFYFDDCRFRNTRFFVDNLQEDGRGYSSNFKVYLQKQDILDEDELRSLREKAYNFFGRTGGDRNLTLDQMRRIDEILKEVQS